MTLSVAKYYLALRKYDLWPHFWQYCVIRYREFQYEVIMSATGCPRKRSSKYGVSLVRADSVATLIMTRIIYLTHCWSLDCHQWRGIFQRIFQLHWAVIPANVWSDLTTLVTKNTEQSMWNIIWNHMILEYLFCLFIKNIQDLQAMVITFHIVLHFNDVWVFLSCV